MKKLIKVISQLLTILLIGFLLALLRQKNKWYYYMVTTSFALFGGLAGGVLFSVVFEDSLAMAVSKELERYWYWYLIWSLLSYYIIEKVIAYIQVSIFGDDSNTEVKIVHRLVGGALSIILIVCIYNTKAPWDFLLPLSVIMIGIYIAIKGKGANGNYEQDLSELMDRKMDDFSKSSIASKHKFLEKSISSDPEFLALAKKFNMTEDEFVAKAKILLEKDPQRLADILAYDVKNSRSRNSGIL